MATPAVRTRTGLHRPTGVVVLLALLVAAAVAWTAHVVVADQERRLLHGRVAEIDMFLTGTIEATVATLSAQGAVLHATDGSRAAYERAAGDSAARGAGQQSFAWLRPTGPGAYTVVGAVGGLRAGEVITDVRTRAFDRAATTDRPVATPVVDGPRRIGLALGAPAAPAGTVLYLETLLAQGPAMEGPASRPFAELHVAVYAADAPDVSQVVLSTTPDLPLGEDARNEILDVGSSRWLLSVSPQAPLVGGVAAAAPWLVLGAGIALALLLGAVAEATARRRDTALALYAAEHHLAETLQRNLLPQLPTLSDVDLAARYLAAGSGQQVGGDWFDVFPLPHGRIGIVIGDVMGHDLAAASAMAQIRAALRAYAVDGAAPATVMNQLDHLVETADLAELVTVFYGVLTPPGAGEEWLLEYCNAGHLPPLLRQPDGPAQRLATGDSVVIGAPVAAEHAQEQLQLPPGSTLLLFTDGLVETPGASVDSGMDRLLRVVEGTAADVDATALCDRILADLTAHDALRDDVALLVLHLPATSGPRIPAQPATRPLEPGMKREPGMNASPA